MILSVNFMKNRLNSNLMFKFRLIGTLCFSIPIWRKVPALKRDSIRRDLFYNVEII